MPPAISRNDWSETASDPNIAEFSNFTGAPDADDCQPGPRRLSRGPSAKQASETAGSRDHNQLLRVEVKRHTACGCISYPVKQMETTFDPHRAHESYPRFFRWKAKDKPRGRTRLKFNFAKSG